MNVWIVNLTIALCLIALVPIRSISVFRLKKYHYGLWVKYGSPHAFQRDLFLKKFPYAGVNEVFKTTGITDKFLIIIYFLLHAVFLILAPVSIVHAL